MGTNLAIITGVKSTSTPSDTHSIALTQDLFRVGDNTVFDVMVDIANADLDIWAGQAAHADVHWFQITATMVLGQALNLSTMDHDRVVVVDLDNTDGRHVLRAFNWANGLAEAVDLTD